MNVCLLSAPHFVRWWWTLGFSSHAETECFWKAKRRYSKYKNQPCNLRKKKKTNEIPFDLFFQSTTQQELVVTWVKQMWNGFSSETQFWNQTDWEKKTHGGTTGSSRTQIVELTQQPEKKLEEAPDSRTEELLFFFCCWCWLHPQSSWTTKLQKKKNHQL